MDTNISVTSVPTSTESVCQLTFELKVIYSSAPDSWPFRLIVGDLNEDKRSDIIILTSKENSVGVLLNNGNGTFATRTNFPNGSTFFGTCLAIADFNNNSRLDLVIGNPYSSDIKVLLGIGNGAFKEPPIYSTADLSYPYFIVTGDFNGDDRLDLASITVTNVNVGLMLGNEDGTFGKQMTFSNTNSTTPSSIAVGDFIADLRLDLVVAYAATGKVDILLGNGDGTFGERTMFSIGNYSFPRSICVADFNSDHYLDLAIVDVQYRNVDVFLGNGDGTFGTQTAYSTGTHNVPNSLVVADIDGDNHLDLAILNDFTHCVGVFLGNGNGTFRAQIQFSTGTENSYPESLTVGDFNGDNRMDFALINFLAQNMIILFNTCECCMFEFVHKKATIH